MSKKDSTVVICWVIYTIIIINVFAQLQKHFLVYFVVYFFKKTKLKDVLSIYEIMQEDIGIKQKIKEYFDYYEQNLIPVIKNCTAVTQKDYWFHWFYTHTDSVVFRWIYYALCLKENPMPVIFACAFHDLARTDDEYNEIHWERAVPIAKEIMENFSGVLTEAQKESIVYAVKNHTVWLKAPDYIEARDYISACLWDADRTRLWWIYWYEESLMSTDEAKKIALWDANEFLRFQNECLWRELDDDREQILWHIAKINS